MNPALRLAGIAAAAAILAACSTPPPPEQKVATLQTTQATTPATSAPAAAQDSARPRERLDMTPDETQQLFETYNQCLADNGFKKGPGIDMTKEAPAQAACLSKKPLPPWEYDVSNPESRDFTHKLVQCLRDKGVRFVDEVPAAPGDDRNTISFGGKNDDSDSITKGLNLTPVCEKELSVGGNK
jgi:hypothetical protein